MKVWEYVLIVYFMKIPCPKFAFFSRLTKFQWCIFRRIHWILTSPDGPRKNPNNRCLYVEVHCALVKHENGKTKPDQYLSCSDCWFRRFLWSTTWMIFRKMRIRYWSYFSKSHWLLQHLSSKLGINWTRKNVNALWKYYFHLWQWV